MRLFLEQGKLVQCADSFIGDRLKALEDTVNKCLSEPAPFATFAALLYCFATIDLLGALHSGVARKGAQPSGQSKKYMQKFMSYTTEQSELLMDLFRHKLVHLAQPRPIIAYSGRLITWRYWHEDCEKHLKIEKLSKKEPIQVTAQLSIECDHVFNVSIRQLAEDIKNSVYKPNGYLAQLENTPDLKVRFEEAISDIFNPEK